MYLEPEGNIPARVNELAASYGVGTPLKRQGKRTIQMFVIVIVLLAVFILSLLDDRFSFWQELLKVAGLLLAAINILSNFYPAYRTKLYICSDGLLKSYKGKDEAIRWDEVAELYLTKELVKLVKQNGGEVSLPVLLMDKKFNTFLADEVTRHLLPGMLARYERGETIIFGDLKVHQQGIDGPNGFVYWRQVGDVVLERRKLSVYCGKPEPAQVEGRASAMFAGTWQTWAKEDNVSWPNLPVFVALVSAILNQREADPVEMFPNSQHLYTLKEAAAFAKRKKRRKTRMAVVMTIVSLLGVLSLIIGIPLYVSAQQGQQLQRDTRLLQSHFRQLAHQPYTVHVPGEHCGSGKNFWLDDDSANEYTCNPDGLIMTQKNFQYEDSEYFTFVPDTLSTKDAFSAAHLFAQNYRLQVRAMIISRNQGTCVSIEVHVQDFQGRQSFDVCVGGFWSYNRCNASCDTYTQIDSGTVADEDESYVIALNVTSDVLTLSIDNNLVASFWDTTYTSTDQINLALYGYPNTGEEVTALFSDFSYVPLS